MFINFSIKRMQNSTWFCFYFALNILKLIFSKILNRLVFFNIFSYNWLIIIIHRVTRPYGFGISSLKKAQKESKKQSPQNVLTFLGSKLKREHYHKWGVLFRILVKLKNDLRKEKEFEEGRHSNCDLRADTIIVAGMAGTPEEPHWKKLGLPP